MTIAVLVYTIVYTAILGAKLEFDWDLDKNELNILNHEIDFADLKDVFEKTSKAYDGRFGGKQRKG